jgi:aminomethyltransferase
MSEAQKTPLYNSHLALGARMVEFAGWCMPIQYEGLKEEHFQVRQKAGAFDVSHMGEISVKGPKSLETLQWLTTNNVAALKAGQAQYSLFPNEKGGIVDDLIIYCIEPGANYLLCVNAANTDKDFAFVKANNKGAEIENISSKWGQIAIQGPEAMGLICKIFGDDIAKLPSFNFTIKNFEGQSCYVARTGYTGEDGAEIFVPWDKTEALWNEFFKKGEGILKPIGLGARDTLRMEMKYSLYGQEITDTTNAYAAGLGWVVKPKDKDFLGKAAMLAGKEQAPQKKLVGIEVTGRGIARQGYKVFSFDKKESGEVTSGTLSPSLNKAIAIAYVTAPLAEVGTELFVGIRDKMVEAKVVKTPFVSKS